MVWEIKTGEVGQLRWAQWVDIERFNAWQSRLNELLRLDVGIPGDRAWIDAELAAIRATGRATTLQDADRIQAQRILKQFAHLRDVWEAISQCLRALNQPAFACPSYAFAYLRAIGNLGFAGGFMTGYAYDFALSQSERLRGRTYCEPPPSTICEMDWSLTIVPRLELNLDSTLNATYLNTAFSPMFTSSGEPLEPDARYPWINGRQSTDADLNFGWLGGPWFGGPVPEFDQWVSSEWHQPPGAPAMAKDRVTALIPGNLTLNLARLVAIDQQLAIRPWNQLVSRSRVYVVTQNAAMAAKYGGSSDEDIARLAGEYEEARENPTQTEEMFRGSVGTAATLLLRLNPAASAIFAGAQLLVEALFAIFGRAVGRQVTFFGEVEPYYQKFWISGDVNADSSTPPAFEVPPAPPVDPSLYSLLSDRRLPLVSSTTGEGLVRRGRTVRRAGRERNLVRREGMAREFRERQREIARERDVPAPGSVWEAALREFGVVGS